MTQWVGCFYLERMKNKSQEDWKIVFVRELGKRQFSLKKIFISIERKFQTEAAKCNFFPHNWKNNENRQRFKNKYLGPAAPQLHNSTNIYIYIIYKRFSDVCYVVDPPHLVNKCKLDSAKRVFRSLHGQGFNILCPCLCQWGLMVMIRLGHGQCRH